jgi:sodium pump decarboxylase gamma subunit
VIEGIRLMVIGMSMVFLLLTVLVLAMHVSARFFLRYAHLFPEAGPAPAAPAAAEDVELAIAVAAASARAREGAQKGTK